MNAVKLLVGCFLGKIGTKGKLIVEPLHFFDKSCEAAQMGTFDKKTFHLQRVISKGILNPAQVNESSG